MTVFKGQSHSLCSGLPGPHIYSKWLLGAFRIKPAAHRTPRPLRAGLLPELPLTTSLSLACQVHLLGHLTGQFKGLDAVFTSVHFISTNVHALLKFKESPR